MDLNAKYENFYYDALLRLIQIRISPKRGKCTVILIPLVLHLRLRIGPIQRNGAAPGVIHIGRFFCPNSVEVVGKINGGER
jgi:hypothetical protein